jgi:hypothetical protein
MCTRFLSCCRHSSTQMLQGLRLAASRGAGASQPLRAQISRCHLFMLCAALLLRAHSALCRPVWLRPPPARPACTVACHLQRMARTAAALMFLWQGCNGSSTVEHLPDTAVYTAQPHAAKAALAHAKRQEAGWVPCLHGCMAACLHAAALAQACITTSKTPPGQQHCIAFTPLTHGDMSLQCTAFSWALGSSHPVSAY